MSLKEQLEAIKTICKENEATARKKEQDHLIAQWGEFLQITSKVARREIDWAAASRQPAIMFKSSGLEITVVEELKQFANKTSLHYAPEAEKAWLSFEEEWKKEGIIVSLEQACLRRIVRFS